MKFTKAVELHNNDLLLSKISNSKLWKIEKDFIRYINYDKKIWKIVIPKWRITDFWSIPKCFWFLLNPTKYISFIIHDEIYAKDFKWIEYDKMNDTNISWEMYLKNWKTYIIPLRNECDKILDNWLKIEWANFFYRFCVKIWLKIWWRFYFRKWNSIKK